MLRRKAGICLLLIAGLSAPGSARAADPWWTVLKETLPAEPQSMRVHLVRSGEPGCDGDCPVWIGADGVIAPWTVAMFEQVLTKIGDRKVPVVIDSRGGTVAAAMAIGEMLRSRGLPVVVGHTKLEPCRAGLACAMGDDNTGVGRVEAGGRCQSACILVLAAGDTRNAAPGSLLGVHQMSVGGKDLERTCRWSEGRIIAENSDEACRISPFQRASYLYQADYLRRMGIDPKVVGWMLETANEGVRAISPEEAAAVGLVTGQARAPEVVSAMHVRATTTQGPAKTTP